MDGHAMQGEFLWDKVEVPQACLAIVSRTRELSHISVSPFYWTAFSHCFTISMLNQVHYCICKFRKLAGLANQ